MKVINGQNLKKYFISAANNLYNHYPEIDALNVFPVPDGDTGINMNLTISSGAKEIINKNDNNVSEIAKSFSMGLLMGARGNSGVILSQIFRGFSDALNGKELATPLDLANAFDNARRIAYKHVSKPVEGTILTVIRESSSVLLSQINEKSTIEDVFNILLKEAKASLQRTPNLLPVLKEVGVVDSGGAGLVKVLEGMQSAVNDEFIEKNDASAVDNKLNTIFDDDIETFDYSVEFILKLGPSESKKEFQINRFTSVLLSHGNALDIKKDDNQVIVYIEAQNPGNILSFAQNFGEFVSVNITNLKDSAEKVERLIELNVEEESKKKPIEIIDEPKDYALIATSYGDGINELFLENGVKYIVSGGQTMNPSTEDFVNIIRQANAKTCYVFPNNSNIILAANQAKDVLRDIVDVEIIPTKTIMQGIVSSMNFIPDLSKKENVDNMINAINSVKSGSVTTSIKDTDINGIHVSKDGYIAIRESKNIISCNFSKIDSLISLLQNMVSNDSSTITILLGNDVNAEEEVNIRNLMASDYKDFDCIIVRGNQPIYSFLVGIE